MDALNQLANSIKMQVNKFGYAGTKDRRGCTTQWVSLKRGIPESLLRAVNRLRGVFVGNFKFSEEELNLGSLQGNRFSIVLRNVSASDEDINSAMTSLRDNGFINYYGLQRFGTVPTSPTHHIGKLLLQGSFEFFKKNKRQYHKVNCSNY